MKQAYTILALMLILAQTGCGRSSFDPQQPGDTQDAMVPSDQMSTMEAPEVTVADGITPADIKLYLRSHKGQPIRNALMNLMVSGSDNVVIPCTTSDAEGKSVCRVYSTRAEIKKITAYGKISLWRNTTFLSAPPMRSAFGIVAGASVETLNTGHKFATDSGIIESPTQLKDAYGTQRAHTSILGSVINP